MPYATYTLSAIESEVASLLSDSSNRHWAVDEIRYAIWEGIREWSAVTAYWRTRDTTLANSSLLYQDLSTLFPLARPRTTTYEQLVREIQFHFHEDSTGVDSLTMSTQFSMLAIVNSLVRARNRFVSDAGMPLTVDSIPVFPSSDGRAVLGESVAILRNLRWVDANGLYYPLTQTDMWSVDYAPPPTSKPYAYSQSEHKPNEFILFPPPISVGSLESISVNTTYPTVITTTQLGVPNDFCHAIKYAAMSDLVGTDSESYDPFLAQYCEARYQMILQSARQYYSLIRIAVNGTVCKVDSITNLNRAAENWSVLRGTPSICGAAYDLVAFDKRPSSNYSMQVDMITAAPIPLLPTDYIQLGREDIGSITDYSQHYLSLKLGGDEFQSTFSLHDSFQIQATKHSALLSGASRNMGAIFSRMAMEADVNPERNELGKPTLKLSK